MHVEVEAAAGEVPADPGVRQAAMARMLMRVEQREAGAVVAELRRAGVDPLLLKGASVQRLLYEEDARSSSDIDLLVAPSAQRAARRALRRLGYEAFARTGHATAWAAEGRAPVDLHRTLPRCQAGAGAVWDALGRHRASILVEGQPVATLDAPAIAVHLTIHLSQTAGARQHEDLHRAVAQLSPEVWRDAAELAARLGTTSTMAWALGQVPGGPPLRRALGLAPATRDQLPPRKPLEAGVRRFVRSPVSWRERAGATARTVTLATSPRSLTEWAQDHGRRSPTTRVEHATTALARVAAHVRRRREAEA